MVRENFCNFHTFVKSIENSLHFFSVNREYTTTLRINKIELLKPIDETEDRTGFENSEIYPYYPEGK